MRVLVELDLKNHTLSDYRLNQREWHPTGDPRMISIDKNYLPDDPTDNSFILVRVRSILP